MTVPIAPAYIDHIKKQLKGPKQLDHFLSSCQQPLRPSIRVNTLKISVADFLVRARSYDWAVEAIPWCSEGYWLTNLSPDVKLGNHPDHIMGLFYIQEASSMLPPVALLDKVSIKQPLILDVAAAPGSKTTQLASGLKNRGLILANELASSRLKGLYSNLERCAVSNTALCHYDGRLFKHCHEMFDAILLDAPCGGEGTVRKDAKALVNWSLARVQELARLQSELLDAAFCALKPGGTLVYSTCTLSREENHDVCQGLIERYGNSVSIMPLDSLFSGAEKALSDEGYLHVLPHIYDSEGFFIARFKKTGSIPPPVWPTNNKLGQFPFQPLDKKQGLPLKQHLKAQFHYDITPIESRLWLRDKTVWLFPHNIKQLTGQIKFDRIGIKVAEIHKSNIKLFHEFAQVFGTAFKHNCYDCNVHEADQFIKGQDFKLRHALDHGNVLLTFEHRVLGFGKNIKGKLKNNLPRELVKNKSVFDRS